MERHVKEITNAANAYSNLYCCDIFLCLNKTLHFGISHLLSVEDVLYRTTGPPKTRELQPREPKIAQALLEHINFVSKNETTYLRCASRVPMLQPLDPSLEVCK